MGPLTGLRVLECGDFVAAPYAAALLGHLGADVVKVEPPGGDSNRQRGPFPGGRESLETGALHLFVDQAKRSVCCDLDIGAGRATFRRLAATADVVIASGAATLLQRRDLTYAALCAVNPRLVVTTITPFGIDAFQREQGLPQRELCDLAASGWLAISPGGLEDPNLPPLKPFGQQAHFQAGIHGALATIAALLARDGNRPTHSGEGVGQHVDVSTQAVIVSQLEMALNHYFFAGRVPTRLGARVLGPWGMLRLADGLLFILCVTEQEWQRLVDFLGQPEWAAAPLFADRLQRAQNNDALLHLIEAQLAAHRVRDTYAALQDRRIPSAPVCLMQDLLEHPHLQAREYFVRIGHPLAGTWTYPGAPWKFAATPWQTGRPAPLLGEHTAEVLAEWVNGQREAEVVGAGGSKRRIAPSHSPLLSVRQGSTDECRLPLHGLRVVDFTWAWAGPTCTLQLAHLGADVLKVESSTRMDTLRGLPPFWGDVRGPNRSGFFNQYNQGKRSVLLNLKHSEGLALAYALIRDADVVVDNFAAGVMDRLGLGYEVVRALNPTVIQISMAAHGQTGPIAQYVAYGPTQVPMMGLASLTGYVGGEPREVGLSYGDPNGGINAALAVLAALWHRRRTGEGQYIDMSQWEAAIPLVVEGLLAHQMEGTQPPRMGNRDQFEAPQGVFRCQGEDQWIAIVCWSDDEWHRLAETIGRVDLRDDPRLRTRQGRKAHEAELEDAIAAWAIGRTREDAAGALRAAGVPTQEVLTAADVAHDPTLADRGFWVTLSHPECPGTRFAGIPWRFSGTPLAVRRPAPCLGEHTAEVLREVLHKTPAEIERLRRAGALQ